MFWKIYFWSLLVLNIFLFAFVLGWFPWRSYVVRSTVIWMDIPVSAVSFVGIFGLAYRRRFGTRFFWRLWLPLLLVWDTGYRFGVFDLTPATLGEIVNPERVLLGALRTVSSLPLLLPAYIALYLYGFRRDQLWIAESGW